MKRSLKKITGFGGGAIVESVCGASKKIMAVASPYFSTSSIKAKRRYKGAKPPKADRKRNSKTVGGGCHVIVTSS